MTVTASTAEEYIVTVVTGDEPATVEILSGGDPVDIRIEAIDADEVTLTVDTDEITAEVPAGDDITVVVDGFETLVQIDDVPIGPRGPVGGSIDTFVWTQTLPSTVWTIDHQLGFDPAGITVVDQDGYFIDGFGVQYFEPGQKLRLTFDLAFAGTARLS